MTINLIAAVGMTVAEMERSLDFYTTILQCQKIADQQVASVVYDQLYGLSNAKLRVVQLRLGNEIIELTEFLTVKGRPIPPDSQSNDRWFQHLAIVVQDMQLAYQHLRQHQARQTSSEPQTLPAWNQVVGGVQAFYFSDPDGHNLELIHFPPGKGDPKWQCASDSLFLGIDHTAIVVANTAISRAFYCGQLGMKLQQESQNFGSEQEHLSDVTGAEVHVSSLTAPIGIGIELLEYSSCGRPMPADTHASDLWFWQTIIMVDDVMTKIEQIHAPKFISSEVVQAVELALANNQGFLIRDSDGHMIKLVQPS